MNVEPLKAVENGQIREDLFYRLNVVNIKLVPLRDRLEDIPLYVEHFIDKYNKELNKNVKGISSKVKELFMSYNWPGNVRELQHIIEAAINIVDNEYIELDNLPIYLSEKVDLVDYGSLEEHFYFSLLEGGVESLDSVMDDMEKKVHIRCIGTVKGGKYFQGCKGT